MQPFMAEVKVFSTDNSDNAFAQQAFKACQKWVGLIEKIAMAAAKDPNEVNAAAYDHLMYAGYTVLAYFWARSAVAAETALAKGQTDAGFYQAKLATARFYFERILTRTDSLSSSIASGADNLIKLDASDF